MGGAPAESAWLLPALLGLFVIGPGFWLLWRSLQTRVGEMKRTLGTIERIVPHFQPSSPLKTNHVYVHYSFSVGPHRFEGSGVVPLARFVQSVIPPGPVLIFDVRINLPVLIAEDTRVVGEEAIEHRLLQAMGGLRISYVATDPARNGVADAAEKTTAELSPSSDPG